MFKEKLLTYLLSFTFDALFWIALCEMHEIYIMYYIIIVHELHILCWMKYTIDQCFNLVVKYKCVILIFFVHTLLNV